LLSTLANYALVVEYYPFREPAALKHLFLCHVLFVLGVLHLVPFFTNHLRIPEVSEGDYFEVR
jgi:hypothetical protein